MTKSKPEFLDWKVYKLICRDSGVTSEQIRSKLNINKLALQNALYRLKERGYVSHKRQYAYYPIEWYKMAKPSPEVPRNLAKRIERKLGI